MRYVKKPVEIDAVQWTGENDAVIQAFCPLCKPRVHRGVKELDIMTLEDGIDGRATHVASIGDFIIKGVHGEFYACKPDIFHLTYASV